MIRPTGAAPNLLRALSVRRVTTSSVALRKHEHRVQYNYDLFSLYPDPEHYALPQVTAQDLQYSKTRPRSVRMLARDFIHDSLYNPYYGYFSRQAVLLPSASGATGDSESFPFNEYKNDTDFMRAVQTRYLSFENKFQEERAARERRSRANMPTLQQQIDELVAKQRQTPWGSAERLTLAQDIGRLQREQSNENVSDSEVDAMVAGQVWHTPTQLFSPHYGRALARYLVTEYKLHLFPYHELVMYELGGGAGTLAKDILDYIADEEPDVYTCTRYRIVEISERLAHQQKERLARHVECGAVEILHRDFLQWNEDVNDPCFVIALEVLDNLAHDVVRYSTDNLQPYQGLVSIDHTGDFAELWEPVQDPLIKRYLKLLSNVRPSVLPPGAPVYLSWLPRWLQRWLAEYMPFYPNLTAPHYLPTGALQMMDVLRQHFPLHRLVISDFSSLPDTIPGVNAPVVQTRHKGEMIPVTTYLVLQGFFDIFFPTDFIVLRDVYLRLMGTTPEDGFAAVEPDAGVDKEYTTPASPAAYFTPTYPRAFDNPAVHVASYEDYSRAPDSLFSASDIVPPPLLNETHEARIMSHAEFLARYAEVQGTQLRDGSNPMVSWYANACWLLT